MRESSFEFACACVQQAVLGKEGWKELGCFGEALGCVMLGCSFGLSVSVCLRLCPLSVFVCARACVVCVCVCVSIHLSCPMSACMFPNYVCVFGVHAYACTRTDALHVAKLYSTM